MGFPLARENYVPYRACTRNFRLIRIYILSRVHRPRTRSSCSSDVASAISASFSSTETIRRNTQYREMIIWKTNFADARVLLHAATLRLFRTLPFNPLLVAPRLRSTRRGAAEGGGQRGTSGHCCNQDEKEMISRVSSGPFILILLLLSFSLLSFYCRLFIFTESS